MTIHLRIDNASERHTRFTVFVNGGNCGQLCMRNDEFDGFAHIVAIGTNPDDEDVFVLSGQTWDELERIRDCQKQENDGERIDDSNRERDRDRCQNELSS